MATTWQEFGRFDVFTVAIPPLRWRFSLGQLLIVVAVACVGVYVAAYSRKQSRRYEDAAFVRANFRRIVDALDQYQVAHGKLPYSESGSNKALFQLNQLIEAEAFQRSRSPSNGIARWDRASGQLLRADVAYLNQPNATLEGSRIILACDFDATVQLFATGDGFRRGRRSPMPIQELLGCWVTSEEFLIAKKSVFDDWCLNHPPGSVVETRSGSENLGPDEVILNDRSKLQYHYADGQLKSCVILRPNGSRTYEEVDTDQYGRITAIRRSDRNKTVAGTNE